MKQIVMLDLYNIMHNYSVSCPDLHFLNTFAEINSQFPLRAELELNKCKAAEYYKGAEI